MPTTGTTGTSRTAGDVVVLIDCLFGCSRGSRRAGARLRSWGRPSTSCRLPSVPGVTDSGIVLGRDLRVVGCTPCTPDTSGKVRGVATATRVPAPTGSDAPGMRLGTKGNDSSGSCAPLGSSGNLAELPLTAAHAFGSRRAAAGLSLSGLGATIPPELCATWVLACDPLGIVLAAARPA